MGACYSVTAKLTYDDKSVVEEAIRNYIRKTSDRINWHLDKYPLDVDLDTLVGYVIMDEYLDIKDIPKGKRYDSGFNQSYSWESVMLEWFKAIAPALRNSSELWIYPDSDYDKVVVKNGTAIQVH